MAVGRGQLSEVVINTSGVPVTGASCQVYAARTVTPSTIYNAETGGATIANPQISSNGGFAGWLDEGEYDLVISGTGFTTYTRRLNVVRGGTTLGPSLAANQITTNELAADSVQTADIKDANVTNAKLATNAVTTAKITDLNVTTTKIADANVTLAKLASNSVDSSKIVDGAIVNADINSAAAIAETKLASSRSGVYRTLFDAQTMTGTGFLGSGVTYIMSNGQVIATNNTNQGIQTSGTQTAQNTTTTYPYQIPPIFYIDSADYTVSGFTTKMRVKAVIATNATAPGITITAGLYPVTVAGAAGGVTLTTGTVVASSTAALTTPGASAVTQANSSQFTIPSNGGYVLGFTLSGANAGNSNWYLSAFLQQNYA